MPLGFPRRRPDSGLGNIRASPAAPGRNVDWVLLAAQGALTVIGCFVIYSATRTRRADPFYFTIRQVVFAIIATIVLAAVMAVDYDMFRARAGAIYLGCIGLLMALLAMKRVSGDRTMIAFDLGPINVQPAEVAKFAVLVALAAYLHEDQTDEVSYVRFIGGLILVGFASLLVVLQPDLGSASVLIAMAMGVLLVAGAKAKYIASYTLLAVLTVVVAFVGGLVNKYQLDRIRVFFHEGNPELRADAYQLDLAFSAFGTGGPFGKGWLKGPLTNSGDIPVLWADFPFAAIGEQFGLVGGALVVGLFIVVLVRVWRIAQLSRDRFGTYICAGVFSMLIWQIFQNIGMTVKLLPVTGLPLPFISYGGSGLMMWFALLGLVQSVHMRRMR